MAQKSLNELFEDFITEAEYVRRKKPRTIYGYRYSFNTFTKLVTGVSLQLLTPQTMTTFFQILHERKRVVGRGEMKSGVKDSTQASYWNKLSAFFTWLERGKHIVQNPLKLMQCPKPTYEDRKFLHKFQIEKILLAIHSFSGKSLLFKRNLALFYILLFCGLRKNELLFLRVTDLDFEKKILTVRAENTKNNKSRQVPLHSKVLVHLEDYLKERKRYTTPYLIVSSQSDERFSEDGLKHVIDKLREISGVRFHLHQFRHTFAVNFLKASRDISKLKQLLGHSDIKMTAVYLRNLPVEEIKTDVELMSMEKLI